jgi:hypothetical protein
MKNWTRQELRISPGIAVVLTVPGPIDAECIFPACPATTRSVIFSDEVIIYKYDLQAEGGTVTRQSSAAGDNAGNKGKVGVPNPVGIKERTKSMVAHAHARAQGMELAGGHG